MLTPVTLHQPARRLVYPQIILMVLLTAALLFAARPGISADSSPIPHQGLVPAITANLPSSSCGGHTDCHFSSPVLYDLTGDGNPEIIVATNRGIILAYRYTGTQLVRLWERDLAPLTGRPANSQDIRSSPAVADINNDGEPEIVIATGSVPLPGVCKPGAVVVLNKNGQPVQPGWPQMASDHNGDGCAEGFFSTPALGDLTGDGNLEIVIGGFDHKIYAWDHTGTLLPGFPADSVLAGRFPTWPNLQGRLADTIWSSPALVDLDGDGYLDIVVGTDEGNFDDRYGGDSGGWHCPYRLPPGWAAGYCGGTIYAFDRFGTVLPGFPIRTLEAIQSTPAIADLNDDGNPDIIIGAGNFYNLYSPDQPRDGFRIYAFDRLGQPLPGWTHTPLHPHDPPDGLVTQEAITASPALGDITGDGKINVVVPGTDGRLYAWHADGRPVTGFPMTPLTQTGISTSQNVGKSVVLADYTGDGKMEIFLTQSWSVSLVDGRGVQLSATSFPTNKPLYLTGGSLLNNPAIGDLNGDGRMELVVFNSKLYLWQLPQSAGQEAQWPFFKRDAARSSSMYVNRGRASVGLSELLILHQTGEYGTITSSFMLGNSGGMPLEWSIEIGESAPRSGTNDTPTLPVLQVSPLSGVVDPGEEQEVTVEILYEEGVADGLHDLGEIRIFVGEEEPIVIPVQLVVGDISSIWLPVVVRP